MSDLLISVSNLQKEYISKDFKGKKQKTVALNGVSLEIYKGETLGLVGESGSGKSTLGKIILGFETKTSGEINIYSDNSKNLKQTMQIIFQDPYSALNPKMSALELVMEPLNFMDKSEAKIKATQMLEVVGISGDDINKLPKHFSGGQRQRIGIARAVVSNPEFIVLDEPTSALDVSIQAQILELLLKIQRDMKLSYLFISHDLSVVEHVSDRIAVMFKGNIVELATKEKLFNNPVHPYTKKLLNAAPKLDPTEAKKQLKDSLDTVDEEILLSDNFEWFEIEPNHFVRR